MTIGSEISKNGPYSANGVTTTFQYDFKIVDAAHIRVVSTVNNTDTTLTSGFTVTGVGAETGGNVIFTVPPSTGSITLLLDPPFLQPTDYRDQATVQPSQVEDDFDLSVQRDLTLTETVSRALKISVSTTAFNTVLPELLPGQALVMGTNEFVGQNVTTTDDPTAISVGSFAEIATSTRITSGTLIVHVVNGYHGDGGVPFSLSKVSTAPDHELWTQHTATGTYFEPIPVMGSLGVHVGGARGRAQYVNAAGTERYEDALQTIVAADDQIAIQKVVDAAIYSDSYRCNVWAAPGWFKLGRSVSIGYGITFAGGIRFAGSGNGFRGSSVFGGTTFYPMFSDRMVFNVQGARSPELVDFAIIGYVDPVTNAINGGPSAHVFDEATWNGLTDYSGNTVANGRYNPYAGITVDAFCGVAPGTAYPENTPPTWIAATPPATYGKLQSSDFSISGVWTSQLFAGIVVQPCDFDANADFTKIRNCAGEMMKVWLAICNTQSRNVLIDGCQMNRLFYGIALNQFGRQTGQLGGEITNLSLAGYVYRAFETDSSVFSGSVTWTNFFAESLYEWINITNNTSNDVTHVWLTPVCNYTGQEANKDSGVPSYAIRGTSSARIHVIGGLMSNFEMLHGCQMNNVFFDGTRFDAIVPGQSGITPAQAMVWNATLGLAQDNAAHGREHNITARRFTIDTGVALGQAECFNDGSFYQSGRATNLPLWVKNYRRSGETSTPGYISRNRPVGVRQRPKTDFTSLTVTNDVLTAVFSATQSADTAIQSGYTRGSLMTDEATGTQFVIDSWNGTDTITGHAVTSIEQDPAAVATVTGITNANPAVVTANNTFTNGRRVAFENVGGMTDVNQKVYLVANATATTFELQDLDGNNVDSSSFGTYTSGGTACGRRLKETISSSVGNMAFVQCGVYALNRTAELVFTTSSTNVAATYRGSAYDAGTEDGMGVGDYFYDGQAFPILIHDGTRSAVAAAASGSITMGTGGARRNHTTLDQLFARAAP